MSRKTNVNTGTPATDDPPDDLYRRLFDSAEQGMAIVRVLSDENALPSDLSFVDVNAAFQEQAGLGNARGMRIRQTALEPEQQDRWVGACGQAATTGVPQHFQHRCGAKCFDVVTFQLRPEDQRHVAIVLEDVTRLEQAKPDLRRDSDLRQSVTDVLLATKMQISFTRSAVREPGLRKLLEKASGLIDDLIRQSDSVGTEGRPPVQHESGLIPGLTQFANWIEKRHHLRVTVESKADLRPENQGAAVVLFAATRELLFNVVKHSGVNEALVTLTENDARIQLSVEDKGVGFDPGVNREGFKPGAGLARVREQLRRIGGDLRVESEPGRGTRVTVFVPASVSPGLGQTTQEPVDAAELIALLGAETAEVEAPAAIRVLLVDDHQVLRQGLASLLDNEAGIEVVGQAGDGYEAIELARRLQPDVVTMDISMPRMNGIDATRQIKSEMPAIRIIGLSMHGEPEQARLLYEAGVDAFLSKGGPSDELIRTIRRIVRPNQGAL